MVTAVAVCLTLLASLLGAGSAQAAQRVTIFDPGEWHVESIPSTMNSLAQVGTDVVRLRVPYQPRPDFDALDQAVEGARARGMQVMLVPIGPAPSDPAFAGFVGVLGAHYPQVHRWAIWNEPDLSNYFPLPSANQNQPPPPIPQTSPKPPKNPSVLVPPPPTGNSINFEHGRAYRYTFLQAQKALVAAGHGPREVLIGETSPCVNIDFILGTLAGKGLVAGGWAHHPYVSGQKPWDSAACTGPGDLHRLHDTLVAAARSGWTKKPLPIYVTEFGIRNEQPPAMQAASEWVMAQPYVRSFAQYSLADDWFQSGLLHLDGSPKPTFSVFSDPLFVRRHRGHVRIWGHLRTLPRQTSIDVYDNGNLSGQIPVKAGRGGYFELSGKWKPGRSWALPGGLQTPAYRVHARVEIHSSAQLRTELRR